MKVENIYIYFNLAEKKFTSSASIIVEGFGNVTIKDAIPLEIIEMACSAAIFKLRQQFKLVEINKEPEDQIEYTEQNKNKLNN